MRRLLLVIALVACKSKSEPAEQARPTIEGPGGAQAGSGSPNVATPVTGVDTGAIQPGKGGEPRRKDVPTADPAPAVPTPAKPDDRVKPAEVANSEAPTTGGFQAPAGRDPGARLPPGNVGFTSITALDTSTLTAADAGRLIKTAYRAGLERCYRVHLQAHAAAKGTAKVTFTVEVNGQVTAPATTSFAPDLEACLGMMVINWRFRVPTDPKTTNPAPVRFAVELTFTPG